MRVVAGKHRSRPLFAPKNNDIRPTTDMIKESIFNIIQNDVIGSKFLDLFAGSGSIGIEAISRGAEKVVFADSNKESINLIKKNLQMLKEDSTIIFGSYDYALSRLKNSEFDIIFLDPPYTSGLAESVCKKIVEYGLLNKKGYMIWERSAEIDINDISGLYVIKQKSYKTTVMTFLALEESEI